MSSQVAKVLKFPKIAPDNTKRDRRAVQKLGNQNQALTSNPSLS